MKAKPRRKKLTIDDFLKPDGKHEVSEFGREMRRLIEASRASQQKLLSRRKLDRLIDQIKGKA